MIQSGALSFLIVDDDPVDREILTKILGRSYPGARLVEAAGIDDIRALDRNEAFDVAFIDFVMPRVNGLHALREMQYIWPYTAYVIVTGKGDEETAAEAIKIGAVDYLSKQNLQEDSIERTVENAREKMILRQALDDQLHELKSFAGALIHDIRAPIRHMRFLCNEVMDGLANGDRDLVVESMRGIDGSCDRISALLSALIQHIQAQEPGEMGPVDTGAMVDGIVEELRDSARDARATISYDSLPIVHGDPEQIRRLFLNLLRNAIAYRSERAPEIAISAEAVSDGKVTFSISDNGIGIEGRLIPTIFQPFQRLHSREAGAGAGLGLATCRKIVDRHGGEIWCDSRPGKGSVFHFTLPRKAAGIAHIRGRSQLERLTDLLGGD